MSADIDLGRAAVRSIATSWQVYEDRIRWVEDGFECWPGRFRVSVRAEKHPNEAEGPKWRLSVRTDFLRDIACGDDKVGDTIFPTAGFSPSYAWVYPLNAASEVAY